MNYKHHLTLAEKRKIRVRSKLRGLSDRPRLIIFRSNKFTYLQVIDDKTHQVIASADSRTYERTKDTVTKLEAATQAAQALVETLQAQKVTAVALDRGAYKYHGRVKAVADALRNGKVLV